MADTEEYHVKLKSLKKYVPFLVNMMEDLRIKGNREAQLNKIQSLHDMITDDKKKLKLETLNRCEEVLTNIYIKVNPQIKTKISLGPASPGEPIEIPDSPSREVDETPRSPSPDPDEFNLSSRPVNIPTEKVHDTYSKRSKYDSTRNRNIPKIDIYGAAAFDILLLDKHRKDSPPPSAKIPDISKPPISLDDLKKLEDDVQDKITAVHLTTRPIDELERYKKELELQLTVDNVNRSLSPKKPSEINTTVRNKLDLSHIKKAKEAKSTSSRWSEDSKSKSDTDSPKMFSKVCKISPDNVVQERSSPMVLSRITTPPENTDNRSPEEKNSKDEKIDKDSKQDSKKAKESSKEKSKNDEKKDKDKKSDRKDKDKKRDSSKDSRDRSKDGKKESSSSKGDSKKKDEAKTKPILNADNLAVEIKTSIMSSPKVDEGSRSSLDNKNEHKKSQTISKKESRKSFEEQLIAPEQQKTFKRLADKYNPKPKKPSSDDFDKLVSKSIEKSMKISPAKVPDIFDRLAESTDLEEKPQIVKKMDEPIPPPASLVRLALNKPLPEPEAPKAVQLPEILQKIFQKANKPSVEPPKSVDPRIDPRKNIRSGPADPRRRNDVPKPPLLSRDPMSHMEMVPPPKFSMEVGPPLLSPPQRNIPSLLSPPQQSSMVSPTQTFLPPKSLLPISNQGLLPTPGGRFQPSNLNYTPSGLDFIPPSPLVDFACPSPRMDFEIPPSPNIEAPQRFMAPDFLENLRPPFQNVNFLSREQFPNEKIGLPRFGGQGNQLDHGNSYDTHRMNPYELHNQSVNFYQVNSYNNMVGMPVLQPEIPHLMAEPKPYLPEPTPFQDRGWNDNMRQQRSWRDDRRPGDARNYREYREKKEKEERERRDREKEREANTRDLRVTKDLKNDSTERSSDRDTDRSHSKSSGHKERSRDRLLKEVEREKPSKLEKSKFDKIYSKTNRDRDRSRSCSKSGSEEEIFVSPLDSLYGNKEDKRTGRGYGVQSFRIPKKNKDERVSKTREKGNDKEKEPRTKNRSDRKIIDSDEDDNLADNLSDIGAPSDNDAFSDQETVEMEPECKKGAIKPVEVKRKGKKTTVKDTVETDKLEQALSDDDVVVVKDEMKEAKKKKVKQEEERKKQKEEAIKARQAKAKQKIIKPKEDPVIKIEESESEEIIEIKDEEKEERKKTLRKKPVKSQSSVASPTKRQPARKAKKNSVPLPIVVKEESEDEVEEITTESEIIDVEDDEETRKEIEELEASQIAQSIKETVEPVVPCHQGATSEELDLFESEYVLEVTGDINKFFKPIEMEIKQEICYDTNKEAFEKNSTQDIIQKLTAPIQETTTQKPTTVKPISKSLKKSSSVEEEALKRMALINKLSKPNETSVAETAKPVTDESEADAAAKELSELLETSKDPTTPMEVSPIQTTPKELAAIDQNLKDITTPIEVSPMKTAPKELKETEQNSKDVITPMEVSPTKITSNELTETERTLKSVEVSPIKTTSKELAETKQSSKDLTTSMEVSPTKTTSKEPTETEQTSEKLTTPVEVSPIKISPAKPMETEQTTPTEMQSINQPSVKAVEVEIQEPTSSQDEPKTAATNEKVMPEVFKSAEVSSQELEKNTEVFKLPIEAESSKKPEESAEPSEPNILAHFFENLLKSNNKQDKKAALFSLIQTFSDSFTDKELNKITKIIRVDQNEDNSDEDSSRKDESEKNDSKEDTKTDELKAPEEKVPEEETPVVGSTTEEEVPSIKLKIIRRLSSTSEKENPDCDTSVVKTTQEDSLKKENLTTVKAPSEQTVEEPVLVSVGERIKNRKRNLPPSTKGKKHKTELDRIHDDIKEMFIRDGVLTATGKRMTRMLKDDPNALSPTKSTEAILEPPKTLRKKLGSKSKLKDDSEKFKDVRIVLSKIPDNKYKIQTKRVLRSNTSLPEDDNVTESNESEESDSESSEPSDSDESEKVEEDNKKSQKSEVHQPKKTTKKRGKSAWALGIIKKTKKKPSQLKSKENSPERTLSPYMDNNASLEEDLDKLFVEPDKNYYYDPNNKKKLTCKLCDFSGMFITTHYLKEHPHSEILCSRFAPEMAADAKKDYQQKKKRYEAIINKRLALKYNYSCRFCGYTSQTQPIFFYEHCTTHTGEYRHQCGICQFYSVTGKTLNQHFLNAHPGEDKNAVRETYTKAIIYGYICGECNYVQLKENAVEEHINIYHLGEKPKIHKINMSKIMDPALEDHKTDLILKPSTPETSQLQDNTPKITKKETAEVEENVKQKKKVKKVIKNTSKETEESVTDSDVPEQKNQPEPPKIRRKPGPKSKTRPLELSKLPPETPSEVETENEEQKIITPPPVRRKPGPKSKTRRKSIAPVEMSESDNQPEPETTDSEISKEQLESSASEDQNAGPKPAKIFKKRRSLEALICKENGEDLDTVIALSSRSSRAAKEKASKHIKFFIETNEGSPRKLKALAISQRKSSESKESEKEMSTSLPSEKEELPPKQSDTNVFTCISDSAQEEKNIREERLKKMEELNKSLNTRSSKLDFVEKLSNRLTNEDIVSVKIKEEVKELDTSLERPETPMPVLEKEVPTGPMTTPVIPISAPSPGRSVLTKPKAPLEIATKNATLEDSSLIPSVNVNLRSNSLFPDIIQKLQGKVGQPQESTSASNEHIQIGNLIKATRQDNAVVFSCHAAKCYVSTKDRMVFQLHCKFGHRDISMGEACLCDKCGVNITSTPDTTLMENLYDHLMYAHSDFLEISGNKPKMLRMRRLSGDKLSIKREEEEMENIKKERVEEEPNNKPEETPLPMDTTVPLNEPVISQGTLEPVADSPFTFKIAEVMSLASDSQASPEGSPQKQNIPQKPTVVAQTATLSPRPAPIVQQPPPLMLISPKPPTQHQLVIKEAKLTQAELNKPRKAPKALIKFVETPADLYKCPHYYCLFTTNFRAFLERHLKAHKSDTEVMIPCVYCDMKTPWEHVPMHIDIRHAHCRFACSFCLYRSWLKEYVCLHQDNLHPCNEYSVIQLPPHKAAKKFSVADLKIDPRTLCEPFRCLCGGGTTKEYLYENEFNEHLKHLHPGSTLQCGYKGCTVLLATNRLVNHWSSFHGISTYQCGYCKMSSKEIVKMYHHFAQFHQWMGPDILVRIGDYVLDINKELGYSSEAFERLAHITNLPSNVLAINRPKGSKSIKLKQLSNAAMTQPTATTESVAFAVDSSQTLTADVGNNKTTTISPTKPPPMTTLTNATGQNIHLIVTPSTSDTSTQSNLYLVPSADSDSTITLHAAENTKSSPVKIISIAKPSPKENVATLRPLKCPNVTVVDSTHSVLSRGLGKSNSPVASKATPTTEGARSKEVVTALPPSVSLTPVAPSTVLKEPTLPPSLSWTKVHDPNKKTDFAETRGIAKGAADGGEEVLARRESEVKEPKSKSTCVIDTPSPILLPEPDENSLDEPLFDNIDINTDSPVEDPLSIEPTIPAIPPFEDHASGEPSEDPLSVPTAAQDPLSSEAESVSSVPPKRNSRLTRSLSNASNLEDETNLEKTGLRGYQLYRCAICSIAFSNANDFRQHVTQSVRCRKEGKRPFQCAHCDKLIKTSVKLMQHVHIHGALRYSCSLCNARFAISYTAKMHMKTRHQVAQLKIIPVTPHQTNPETDSFVVRPVLALQPPAIERPSSGRDSSAGESPGKSAGDVMTFMPDQIEGIPIRQIFTQNAKCGLCNYQTKVRVNILRHLQMHSDDKWVPDTAPVNPVPCLEKNEKMFDKMINLASSSIEGRVGKEKDEEKLPEYVPSHCRFICCAQNCTYLCLEESNLRHHIMALHSDEPEFNCGHCKNKIEPPDVDSVIKHLKLHSLHLYKCKYCSFVHNLKHKVERHVSDAHSDLPVKVVTVRNMDAEQENERSVETVKETNVNKTRPWKCCFCKYATTTEDLCRNHISTKHNLNSQYMCALCTYKSDEKHTFNNHFIEKHPQKGMDIIYAYHYLEDEVPKEDEAPVDNSPLWQRDKPRVRHIRGILFDESSPQPVTNKSPKIKGPKPGPSVFKSNSRNLFDAIDAVARGESRIENKPFMTYEKKNREESSSHKPLVAYGKQNKEETSSPKPLITYEIQNIDESRSLKQAVDLQNDVVKRAQSGDLLAKITNKEKGPIKSAKTLQDSDPLKLPATKKSSVAQNKALQSSPRNVATIVEPEEDAPPTLTNVEGDNDVKEILPTLEEINKIKQGSNDPIIIIDDDEDDDVIVQPKPPAPEQRGKKRGGGATDLLQEALKMAKLDEMDRTDVDEDGIPITEYSEESLKKMFGEFGSPNNRQWKCPLCLQFRSKRISDFIFHIFKDLNVFRYQCKACKDESITFKYMIGHIKTHFEPLTEDDIDILPPNNKLETWIQMVLREQSIVISNNIQNMSKPVALVDENIPCMFCSLRFPNAAEASEHMLKHWITKPFLCMYCPKDFYTRFELRHHQTTSHPNLKHVLTNISPTVSEAMHRFDDGFRKRPLATSKQDFPVAKRMKFNEDARVAAPHTETINIVSVNDILNKGKEESSQQAYDLTEPSTSGGAKKSNDDDKNNTINIDSDEDLVMVTKTDEFVPNEDEVYACMMCAFVTDRELSVTKHLEANHGSKSVTKFKVLSKKEPEASKDFLACNVCHQVLPELKLRLHFIDNHQALRCAYSPYVFTCNLCASKFTLLRSMKMHFTSKHQNQPLDYKTIEGYVSSGKKGSTAKGTVAKNQPKQPKVTASTKATKLFANNLRLYQCVLCDFSGEARTPNPMRSHLKSMHLKPVACNVCRESFRNDAEAIAHHRKCHDIDSQPSYTVLDGVLKEYLETMRFIIKMSTPAPSVKKTARKSTGSFQTKKTDDSLDDSESLTLAALERPDSTDANPSPVRTTLLVNGSEKIITVEELGTLFPLETYVDLTESRVSEAFEVRD